MGLSSERTEANYYRARYYHPGLARFISEDPIGFDGGDPNFYAYVGNGPLSFRDPSGDIAIAAPVVGRRSCHRCDVANETPALPLSYTAESRKICSLARGFYSRSPDYENGKLVRLPVIHKPKEGVPREGFFERDQYEAVRRRLTPDLQVAVAIAYTFGWRMQSEVLMLECRQLDLDVGNCDLNPGRRRTMKGASCT